MGKPQDTAEAALEDFWQCMREDGMAPSDYSGHALIVAIVGKIVLPESDINPFKVEKYVPPPKTKD